MVKHDDGSTTFTADDMALIAEAWNDLDHALGSLPVGVGDMIGYGAPYFRYHKVDALLNGYEWPGIRKWLEDDYGEEYAAEEYPEYFKGTPEEAEALLMPESHGVVPEDGEDEDDEE